MKNFKLVVSLIILPPAGLSIWAGFKFPSEGLWMNLGTELIGVLFTVVVVDYLIERHQSAQWRGYKSRGAIRCRILCNAIISSLRSAGGWPVDSISWQFSADEKTIHGKIIEFGQIHIKKHARQLATGLTIESWNTLQRNFSNASQEIETIIQRFNSQLTPVQLECLDEVSNRLSATRTFPITFPEMFDIEDKLERPDIRPAGIAATAKAIVELIDAVSAFSANIE